MDEPTSNLDSLNEGVILKAVKEECRDKLRAAGPSHSVLALHLGISQYRIFC